MPKLPNIGSAIKKLLIADDHELFRTSTRDLLLCAGPDLRVIDEAKDAQEALELCRLHRPDLVLTDVRLPRMNGLEAIRAIKEELPATKILIVSAERVGDLELLRSGADGSLSKPTSLEELLDTIWRVLAD